MIPKIELRYATDGVSPANFIEMVDGLGSGDEWPEHWWEEVATQSEGNRGPDVGAAVLLDRPGLQLIWRAAKDAAAFYMREATSRLHASNIIPGAIQRMFVRARADRQPGRRQAPPVSADAEMLRSVFQNLLIKGGHAMKGKGRIFTPFFTTKARGSGLGLPTAKRFVEAHNGQIAIECPSAGGTTVIIRLPMSPVPGSTKAHAEARA